MANYTINIVVISITEKLELVNTLETNSGLVNIISLY